MQYLETSVAKETEEFVQDPMDALETGEDDGPTLPTPSNGTSVSTTSPLTKRKAKTKMAKKASSVPVFHCHGSLRD